MRKWIAFLIACLQTVVVGATECPVDGLYESIMNRGYIDGELAITTPWVQIGVNTIEKLVYYLRDSDLDESLEDEITSTYHADFYADGIVWRLEDGRMAGFSFSNKDRKWRLTIMEGTRVEQIEFVMLEDWQ